MSSKTRRKSETQYKNKLKRRKTEITLTNVVNTPRVSISSEACLKTPSTPNLYKITGPNGINSSQSQNTLPKVRFQRELSTEKSKYPAFQRYLEHKYGKKVKNLSPPEKPLPIKRPRSVKLLKNNLYDLLELTPSCTESDIRQSYKRLAIKCHPDKGGDPKHFRCLKQAYDILGNVDLKEIYDNEGLDGVNALQEVEMDELLECLKSS
ncbi:unnamed protein product [Blepharisma stoltei]|uniref:J domain-containing protein n=1 Tax=Blepharisma stoltei TaxID=1481888 RepID=A0AAU9K469_9CILI|nr:unnamed protein product [Blepharisma stoltei]